MKVGFIRQHAEQFDITVMCRLLGVSRSGYYAALRRPVSRRARENEELTEAIRAVHSAHRQVYGSPRIWRQLRRQGIGCGRHRVARLMRQHGIAARQRQRCRTTTNSRHTLPVAGNVLARDFRATAVNQKWVADITYIRTEEGWLYLAAVMDLFSRRIVGWSMSARINAALVLAAQTMALHARCPAPGLLQHTDRGSQYASDDYQQLLSDHRSCASMSGVGNCYDNAAMESFFHTLKTELIYQRRYPTHAQARADIFDYIEVFYNRQRQHSTLGYKSPAEFEADLAQGPPACPP
jgi:transposase InsO family protein